MRTFVTGGTGFVGRAVRRLLEAGHEVRALVRPGADTRQLDDLPVIRVSGDLNDTASLRQGMAGCQWVFHVAALFSYWGHCWSDFYSANVEGTRRLMQAAGEAGVQRVVVTSSIVVFGIHPAGFVISEQTPSTLQDMIGPYARSKFMAEEEARAFAAKGLPVVIVNPTAPIGIGDLKPTPTGQMVVDFLKGRMPGYVDTRLNIIDVEDVAAGHLLAAERGRLGERYILGGENLSLRQVLDILAEVSGKPGPRLRVPPWVALAWAYADAAHAQMQSGYTPTATPEKVRYGRTQHDVDAGKAVRQLGLPQTPARVALGKAVAWYRAHGYAP